MAAEVSAKLGDELRPALEEALAAEKEHQGRVRDPRRTGAGRRSTRDSLACQSRRADCPGSERREKAQSPMAAGCPLPTLHLRDHTHAQVSEDRRAALLTAYCELGRIGRSETAASLAEGIEEGDLTVLAHEVYEKWLAEGAPSKTKWVLAFAAVFGGPP